MDDRKLSRRRFLQVSAAGTATLALAACPAPAAPQGAPASGEAAAARSATSEEVTRWLTGQVDADITGDFKIMSWEDEGEIRKFLLHIEDFFSKFYPGMTPEVEWGIPWGEYWTKLPTLMAAGTPPDMAWQHQSRGEVFPSKGWSIELTDYIEAYPPDGWPDDWWEASVDTMSFEGKVYAIPYDWATHGIYVNRDIVDELAGGYPVDSQWTLEDLKELAISATGENADGDPVWGFNDSTGASSVWNYAQRLGGRFFDDDITTSMLNSPEVIEAARYLWDLRWTHNAMPTPEDEQSMGMGGTLAFASGRVAMHRSLNDEAFRLDEAIEGRFNWGVYPIPVGPEGRIAFAGNSGWFVPTGSRYPDMAYELIRYGLSNPDILPTTGTMGSMIVSRESFWEWGLPQGDLAEQIPNYKEVFVDIPAENQTTFPNWPGFQEWNAIWTKWTDPIFVEGQENIEEAFNGLHEETIEFLSQS
ncbi:MAG: sugar ABC transporter substrate-binding protein [Chloroflexota bacterium]